MKLVKGDHLTDAQRAEVKAAFIYWRNDESVSSWEEWISRKAFYITRQGKLAAKPNYCEPVTLVGTEFQGKYQANSEFRRDKNKRYGD